MRSKHRAITWSGLQTTSLSAIPIQSDRSLEEGARKARCERVGVSPSRRKNRRRKELNRKRAMRLRSRSWRYYTCLATVLFISPDRTSYSLRSRLDRVRDRRGGHCAYDGIHETKRVRPSAGSVCSWEPNRGQKTRNPSLQSRRESRHRGREAADSIKLQLQQPTQGKKKETKIFRVPVEPFFPPGAGSREYSQHMTKSRTCTLSLLRGLGCLSPSRAQPIITA